jgi:uncharacterized membrane protein
VVTVTGTGWVDPDAAKTVEYMHRGDTALVALQFSYLPSWLSFLVDAPKAAEAETSLQDGVLAWWSRLPAGSRPRLMIFPRASVPTARRVGLPQADVARSVAAVVGSADGVLWVRPTDANPIW